MISISRYAFLILFLTALIEPSFERDLMTRVLKDFLVEASYFSISLKWFLVWAEVLCSRDWP